MKRILLIAYYFPPLGGGGVQRPLQWVRHLPSHGWLPTVLTVEGGYWSSRDEGGLALIPPEVQVVRTRYLSAVSLRARLRGRRPDAVPPEVGAPGVASRPRQGTAARAWLVERLKPLWQTPDEFLGWYPFAVGAARRLLAEDSYQAVLSTAPPYTCHWIARSLRRSGGPPWVADFRDAWTDMPGYPHTGPVQLAIERWMERRVLESADRLIATTEPTAADFVRRCARLGGRTAVIENGYDPQLYAHAAAASPTSPEKLLLVFTGTQILGQDIGRFLASLRRWVGEDTERRRRVRLVYAGPEGPAVAAAARAAGAEGLLDERGYLSHQDTASLQQQAGVLLLPLYEDAVAQKVIPGKLFEYLAAGRPILALIGPGPARDIMGRARAGWTLPPQDEPSFSARLDAIWADWREGRLGTDSDRAWIEQRFARPGQVARLAGLLDELSNPTAL